MTIYHAAFPYWRGVGGSLAAKDDPNLHLPDGAKAGRIAQVKPAVGAATCEAC
jgi:hypothetical protein